MQDTINSSLIACGFVLATVVISIQGEKLEGLGNRMRSLERRVQEMREPGSTGGAKTPEYGRGLRQGDPE